MGEGIHARSSLQRIRGFAFDLGALLAIEYSYSRRHTFPLCSDTPRLTLPCLEAPVSDSSSKVPRNVRQQKMREEEMTSFRVDLDALVVAFSDDAPARSYYLDKENGQVFSLLEDHVDPETEEIAVQIEVDGGRRYLQVPKLTIEEELQEQDSFLESLDDEQLKTQLAKVIESDHDGSQFQEFVSRQREAREPWRNFCRTRARERADQWLKSLGLPTS